MKTAKPHKENGHRAAAFKKIYLCSRTQANAKITGFIRCIFWLEI